MAMVSAYFDESDSSSASAVAGIVSTADKWRGFEGDWSRLLDKYHLSALHMKDFAHSRGEFSSWAGDDEKRRQFLGRVIEIMGRRCQWCIGIVIDRKAFSKIISPEEDVSSFYSSEYTQAAFMALLLTGKWSARCRLEHPVNFVFDRGNRNRPSFQRAYDHLYANEEERSLSSIGPLSFADDVAVSPLQVADFVAYECCKVYTDLDKNVRRFRESLKQMMKRVNFDVRVLDEEALKKFMRRLREGE
jgi:hypothetical protein